MRKARTHKSLGRGRIASAAQSIDSMSDALLAQSPISSEKTYGAWTYITSKSNTDSNLHIAFPIDIDSRIYPIIRFIFELTSIDNISSNHDRICMCVDSGRSYRVSTGFYGKTSNLYIGYYHGENICIRDSESSNTRYYPALNGSNSSSFIIDFAGGARILIYDLDTYSTVVGSPGQFILHILGLKNTFGI